MAREYQSETARLSTLAQQHLWMPYSPPGSQGRSADPIRVITRGQGCTIWDSDGHAYLDGTSALEAMILGHGATEVIEAISAQARELAYLDVFRFASPPQIELAAELAAVAPGMEYVHFTPGGAEADEAAIKLARQYHYFRGQPHRMKVITRQGSFHGVTQGAMALDGGYFASYNVLYDGGLTWGRTAPAPACPRCDFGKAARYVACAHNIEAIIRAEGPDTVAAVVVDPVATAIGVATPPDSDLQELESVCRRHGVLLIVDEIITGMGRTGRLFCSEYSGVTPDFITLSKGLSSGYVPIAATLVSRRVADAFRERADGIFRHGHTYGGHPLGAAAARVVLKRVCEERLWERADVLGKRLLDGLRNLSEHRYFWDARGRGLLVGLEIVADQRTGEGFADPVAAGNRLRIRCRELGLAALILHPGNVLFLAPPLVISEQEVGRMVAIVEEALADMEDGRA
jgi:adenosylmethionine-8-amino-7-oxononanoate aminotransferase